MKITVNIDCTPEEARSFMGLPDVKPMQEMMMEEIKERMRENLSVMDPDTLFKIWMPTGIQNVDQFKKMFWSQFGKGPMGGSSK